MRCFRWFPLLPIALLCLAVVAAAQRPGVSESTSVSRSNIAPGIRTGQIAFSSQRGVVDVQTLEVDFSQPMVSAVLVAPPAGLNDDASLESLAAGVGGRSAVALELRATLGAIGAVPAGLRRSGKDLLSWPAGSGVHLALLPEGTIRYALPGTLRGSVDFDDGTSLTLRSVNGELPAPGGAEASVYTGTLRASEVPVIGWPTDLIIVELYPARDGADPHELFTDVTGADRRFRPVRLLSRDDLRLQARRAALVLAPPVDPAVLERLQRASSVITVPSATQDTLPEAIFPCGEILIRGGKLEPGVEPRRIVFNALAFNPVTRRMMAVAPWAARKRGSGVPIETLAPFLADEGYTELVELPGRASILLPDASDSREHRQAATLPTRLALVVKDSPAILSIPNISGDLYRVRGIVVQGTRREFPQNQPGALRDEKSLPDPSLTQFWAIPFDAAFGSNQNNPNAIRLLMPRPMPVAAIELAHAEECGFSPAFDLKGYRLLGKEKRDGPWLLLLDVTHAQPVRRERIAIPGAPRLTEMRLEVTAPSFLPGGNVARLAELFVWSTEKEVERR